MEEQKNKKWSISLGTYPGFLIGIRSYRYETVTTHVLYVPFIDIALEIFE